MNKLSTTKVEFTLTEEATEFLDIGYRAEVEVAKLERAAIPYVLVAGAAFHLAKAEMPHGQWERYLATTVSLPVRRVQERMASVTNALVKLGYEIESRAFKTIVFSSKIAKARDRALLDTPYSAALVRDISEALTGKSQRQLELYLGVRAPKKPLLPPPQAKEEDPAAVARREIGSAMDKFREGLALLQHRRADLDDRTRAEVGYHCANHVQHMIPAGWQVVIRTHTGQEMTMQQVFAEHLGLPEAP
jgi:hypothetical protein